MNKLGLLMPLLVLSPLSFSIAAETNINIANDTAKLSNGKNKQIITLLKKDNLNLSHITYNEFNVGNEGIIFNNKIGADAIINEVVSHSPSELNGEIRLTGKTAKFILINPNGIICSSSCSFRNITHVNLVVGQTMLPSGSVVGRYADSTSALVIKNTTKKIAKRLILNSKNIEISNSKIKTDHLMLTNIYNYMNGDPSRNKISIDKNSTIISDNINFNVIETNINNEGVIKGNIRGMAISSEFKNEGEISGETLSLQSPDNSGITGNGKVTFKNGSL